MDKKISIENKVDFYEYMLDESGAFIYAKDNDGYLLYANKLFLERFGQPLEEVIGKKDYDFFDVERSEKLRNIDMKVINSGESLEVLEKNVSKISGETNYYMTRKKPLYDDNQNIIGIIGVSTDVTELHNLQEELEKHALTDHLTGAYNRRYFFNRANEEISRLSRTEEALSLVLVDIDDFKKINDSYGHTAGDYVIQVVSDFFREELRTEDIFARLAGAEFAFMLPKLNDIEAASVANRLKNELGKLKIKGDWDDEISITLSCGVSQFIGYEDFEFIYSQADRALYYAKENGKNIVVRYSEI